MFLRRFTRIALSTTCAASLVACGGGDDSESAPAAQETIEFGNFKADSPESPAGPRTTVFGEAAGDGALLELLVTDVWGRLPDRKGELVITRDDGASVKLEGYLQPIMIRLDRAGSYQLEASIPDHLSESMKFSVPGDGSIPVPGDQVTHWSFSKDLRTIDGAKETVHGLYLGLEHKYFAASGPAPRRGNDVELFDNGKAAFGSLHADLGSVRDRFHVSLWLMQPDFELVRDDDYASVTEAQRQNNTILAWLDALPGTRRVLLNEYWGDEDLINETVVIADELIDRAKTANDGVEVMLQPNETEVPYYGDIPLRDDEWSYRERLLEVNGDWAVRDFLNEETFEPSKYDRKVKWTDLQAGSWHQKFFTLDQEIAYLGGMNMNYADWDTEALEVYHPLRMPIDASTRDRADVQAGAEDAATRPRRDYMLRLQGRIVDDIEGLFQKRWDLAIMNGSKHADKASGFSRDVPVDPRGQVAGIEAQLNVTTPMPFWEHSALEGMRRIIENAEHYIYIEDQYFRAPVLNAIIKARMRQVPDLKLIVVTTETDYTDPGRKWTAIGVQEFQTEFSDRFLLMKLVATDFRTDDRGKTKGAFVNVDVHSKMLIVDDEFMSVGSCNKNNRGLIYEGEANVLIRDAAFVAAQRRAIFVDMVGPNYASGMQDVDTAFELFRSIIEFNQSVYNLWDGRGFKLDSNQVNENVLPAGRLFPLEVPNEWWFNVGPDFA